MVHVFCFIINMDLKLLEARSVLQDAHVLDLCYQVLRQSSHAEGPQDIHLCPELQMHFSLMYDSHCTLHFCSGYHGAAIKSHHIV